MEKISEGIFDLIEKDSEDIFDYIEVFKAFSDVTRLKMMWLLYTIDEKITVSEMIKVLGVNQYNASKHLKILREAGLICRKRNGKWHFYYYINKDSKFDKYIRKAVMEIPESLLSEEIDLCKMCLEERSLVK